jgi:type II secretory pathway component PulF
MSATAGSELKVYRYQALDSQGGVRRAYRRAFEEQEVADHVSGRGLTLVDIAPAKGIRTFFASWFAPDREVLEAFFRDFALMIGSKAEDLQAIFAAIARPLKDRRFAEVVEAIGYASTHGSTIADEMERHPWAFSKPQTALIRAGQDGPGLEVVANDIADTIEEQLTLSAERSAALQDGKIAAVTLILTLHGLFAYIVPQLADLFVGPGKITPPLLNPLLAISNVYASPVFFTIELFLVAVILYPKLLKLLPLNRLGGNVRADALLLRMPLFGVIDRWIAQGWFASTMGMLMKNGIDPLQALEYAIPVSGRPAYIARLEEIQVPFSQSVPLSLLLRETKMFDDVFLVPLSTAEEGGLDLADRLVLIGQKMRERASRRLSKIARPLGAAVQLFIGAIGVLLAVGMGVLVYQVYVSTSINQ